MSDLGEFIYSPDVLDVVAGKFPQVSAELIQGDSAFRFIPKLGTNLNKDFANPKLGLITALGIERAILIEQKLPQAPLPDGADTILSDFYASIAAGEFFDTRLTVANANGFALAVTIPTLQYVQTYTQGLYYEIGEQLKALPIRDRFRQIGYISKMINKPFAVAAACRAGLSFGQVQSTAHYSHYKLQAIYNRLNSDDLGNPHTIQFIYDNLSSLAEDGEVRANDPIWFGYPLDFDVQAILYITSLARQTALTIRDRGWTRYNYLEDNQLQPKCGDIIITKVDGISMDEASSAHSLGEIVNRENLQTTVDNILRIVMNE